MSDELRENLRRLIVLHITSSGYTVDELTDAAIALVSGEQADRIAQLEAELEQCRQIMLEAAMEKHP